MDFLFAIFDIFGFLGSWEGPSTRGRNFDPATGVGPISTGVGPISTGVGPIS
jgi:hypothetical protein